MVWRRPVPSIGDQTSAHGRAADPQAWAFDDADRAALYAVLGARRDVRRYRPDPVPDDVLDRVLEAAHQAPSVGHSQPWRFVTITEPGTRERAAFLADRERLEQASHLDDDAAARLLDLQLEGIREAPLGVVVCCDRRTAPGGVLGRATFHDADLWSCACAIENLWLAARAEGLGVGWVTLFRPADLADLVGAPEGVETLGWLCVGWPDERPPSPGLERAGWSRRQPLAEVVLRERWPSSDAPSAPASRLRAPGQAAVVAARDAADDALTPVGSLGVLDRAVDRVVALRPGQDESGTLVLAGGTHLVVRHGVTAFADSVTDDVLAAARLGSAAGAVAARTAGLEVEVVDAGAADGDLVTEDALIPEHVDALLALGRSIGSRVGVAGLVALGEVGMGNTTIAAALAAALLDLPGCDVCGLGSASDSAMVARKVAVVDAAVARATAVHPGLASDGRLLLAALGGPELAVLAGVALGAASVGAPVVLDGLATSVAALCAALIEPGLAAHLVAGHRSREVAHAAVLRRLGLEPLLELRLRAGEGVGACLAVGLLHQARRIRDEVARTVG